MTPLIHTHKSRIPADARIVALLFTTIFIAFWGIQILFNTTPNIGYPMYISAMIASGRGFVEPLNAGSGTPNFDNAPEMERFFKFEIPRLRPEDIPKDFPVAPSSYNWVDYHKYLFYTVGFLWRMAGISWNVLRAFRAFLLCVMVAASFGIMRLVLGRKWSVAATLLLVPGYLSQSFTIRDFSKGAFILVVILILGYLGKNAVRRLPFLCSAAFLGALIGIGVGFRADVFACMPAGLFMLLFCARPKIDGSFSRNVLMLGSERLLAAGLLIGAMTFTGWPIFKAYYMDRLSSHDFSKGLATVYDDIAGVSRASYERIYYNNDEFVSETVQDYSARKGQTGTAESDMNARREDFVRAILKTFPGDVVTRAYVSLLWCLRGGMFPLAPQTGLPIWKILGLAFGSITILLLAWNDFRRAFLIFGLLMYFCGYISIQACVRHGFHLEFIPLFLGGLFFCRTRHALRTKNAGETESASPHVMREFSAISFHSPVRRLAAFTFLALFIIVAPLYAGRMIQFRAVRSIVNQCENAKTESIPVVHCALGDWTLFRREKHAPKHSGTMERPELSSHGEYWMAEFAATESLRRIFVYYDCQRGANDYSQGLLVMPAGGDGGDTVRYFFPVYEKTDFSRNTWAVFSGIAVPNDCAGNFKGLYRISDTSHFDLFLNLTLPSDRSTFIPCQTIFGDAPPLTDGNENEGRWIVKDDSLMLPGISEVVSSYVSPATIDHIYTVAAKNPENPIILLRLATALESNGNREKALSIYREALSLNPDYYVTYHYLDAFFARNNDMDGRVSQWRDTILLFPDRWLPYFHLAVALEENQDKSGALECYRKVVSLNPSDFLTWHDIARLSLDVSDVQGAESAYRHLLEWDPKNIQSRKELDRISSLTHELP